MSTTIITSGHTSPKTILGLCCSRLSPPTCDDVATATSHTSGQIRMPRMSTALTYARITSSFSCWVLANERKKACVSSTTSVMKPTSDHDRTDMSRLVAVAYRTHKM